MFDEKKVLGVIRKQDIDFLNELKNREDVYLIDMDDLRLHGGCVIMASGISKRFGENKLLVDFHGEASSEKGAMAWYLDGRVQALWGTHTHVPTADPQVLPKGTGYVTDLGMTGPRYSVLGIRPALSIAKFRGDLTSRYQWAEGPTKMEAVLFTVDTATGLCRRAERVDVTDENSAQR